MQRSQLQRYAWLSVAAALVTIGLKTLAYGLTGSVGLLSDAAESLINLAAALLALIALTVAARPADEDHRYGHEKAEYFSSGAEGGLILLAALTIGISAIRRLLDPVPLENTTIGLAAAGLASLVNLWVARVLLQVGKAHDSISLQADAQHLMTDVWTSVGVILAVGAVALTGWLWLDPLIALAVGVNIFLSGFRLVRSAVLGLMDTALPPAEQGLLEDILEKYAHRRIRFHALRTRQAGARRVISFHVLVPGKWTVQRGHQLLEQIEAEIRQALPNATVFTHLEPIEDPVSQQDTGLDRPD